MWLFFLNGLLYVAYTLFSGEWRELAPDKHSFKEAFLVVLHDLHLRKALPPQGRYNAAQKIAYSSIIVMGAGSVITGLAIYKPVQFNWLCALLGGYELARIFHFALTIGYCLFFVIHIAQVILAGWDNYRSMVTGYSVSDVPEVAVVVPVPVVTEDAEPPTPPILTDIKIPENETPDETTE